MSYLSPLFNYLSNFWEGFRTAMHPEYTFCPFKVKAVEIFGNRRPKPRSGHRIVTDNVNVYSFGGYNPLPDNPTMDDGNMADFVWVQNCLLFRELWKFNIATHTWTKMRTTGQMPEELASHSVILSGDNLIVFGGTGVPFGLSSSNAVNIINLRSLEWQELQTSGEHPLEQYGQAIAISEEKLYVVGGTTGYEFSMNVHCLDLKTREWKELYTNVMPNPRYRHEIAIKDGTLFVFGGGTVDASFSLKEIPVFNLTDTEPGCHIWTIMSTSQEHPGSRKCHGCVRMNNDVYIFGGVANNVILEDMWKINLVTLQWEKLPCTLPRPVYFHSAALTEEGQMFIFGGVTSIDHNTRTDEVFSVWLKIPSLKEISWESILHYIPHIGHHKKSTLESIGIPRTFIDRIDFNSKAAHRSSIPTTVNFNFNYMNPLNAISDN